MLIAGILHASWHAIVKTGTGLPILAGMGVVSSVITLPCLFFVPTPSGLMWLVLLLSVVLHSAYKVSLSRAYASADFSRAYPLARGLVPLFAAAFAYIWLNQLPSPGQSVGIFAIVFGAAGLAIDRVSWAMQMWSLLAAIGASLMVAGYSVVDAWGVRAGAGWSSFTAWLIVIDSLAFMGVARLIQGPTLWSECVRAKKQILIAGVLGVVAFAVFVWALGRNAVANVTAFRECSVLFGALIGMTLLREPFTLRKLSCVSLITVGLALVAMLK